MSLAKYADCRIIMDMALENPGLVYELGSIGDARNFKQRCYKLREAQRDIEKERTGNTIVSVPYDTITIRFANRKEGESASNFLLFEVNEVTGVIHLPNGETLNITDAASTEAEPTGNDFIISEDEEDG